MALSEPEVKQFSRELHRVNKQRADRAPLPGSRLRSLRSTTARHNREFLWVGLLGIVKVLRICIGSLIVFSK